MMSALTIDFSHNNLLKIEGELIFKSYYLIYTFYKFSGSPFKSLSPTPKCVPDKDESQEEEEDENGNNQ